MATAKVQYEGALRCKAEHLRSGQVIVTDAPTDNNGKGEAFSPTDLLATSLATCMITIMGIRANAAGISIDGTEASVLKTMGSEPRRHVAKLEVSIMVPNADTFSEKDKKLLKQAALTCPVAESLSERIEQEVHFNF